MTVSMLGKYYSEVYDEKFSKFLRNKNSEQYLANIILY